MDEVVFPAVNPNFETDPLTEIIKNSDDLKVVIDKSEFSEVTKSALKYLYDSETDSCSGWK